MTCKRGGLGWGGVGRGEVGWVGVGWGGSGWGGLGWDGSGWGEVRWGGVEGVQWKKIEVHSMCKNVQLKYVSVLNPGK